MIEGEPVTGEVFLAALRAALPEVPNEDLPEEAEEWSTWMFQYLHKAQLELGLICSCESPTDGLEDHEGEECLFDLTWYNRSGRYSLPCVIIEHENKDTSEAFLDDQWKLLAGWAPLRVMFGYTSREGGYESLLAALNRNAETLGWAFPDGVEDIALIGHYDMTSRGFHVLRRRPGERRWSDVGLLGDWL